MAARPTLLQRRIDWSRAVRIVSSRFPPRGLWDEVADPADLDAVMELEGRTNPRLRQELGEISLIPPRERLAGPGTTPIMAAFTHLSPQGSRFSDGSYGVYYAARDEATAIAETVYHREQFLRYSHEAPIRLEMRVYVGRIAGRLHDLRGLEKNLPDVYSPDSYIASQALGRELRDANSPGIVYDSVRHDSGQCIAAFKPRIVKPVTQASHLAYHWDGERIVDVVRLRRLTGWE